MNEYAGVLELMGDIPTHEFLELGERWYVDVLDMVLRRGTERGEVTDYRVSMILELPGYRKPQFIRVNSGNGWDYFSIAPDTFDTAEVEFLGTESDVSIEKSSNLVLDSTKYF